MIITIFYIFREVNQYKLDNKRVAQLVQKNDVTRPWKKILNEIVWNFILILSAAKKNWHIYWSFFHKLWTACCHAKIRGILKLKLTQKYGISSKKFAIWKKKERIRI